MAQLAGCACGEYSVSVLDAWEGARVRCAGAPLSAVLRLLGDSGAIGVDRDALEALEVGARFELAGMNGTAWTVERTA